jgi:hypothetical protein
MGIEMAEGKVRCDGCGAKNTDPMADRCRICGALLPDATKRRAAKVGATAGGPAFTELVETEVSAWREYAEARNRSRKPVEDESTPQKIAEAGRTVLMLLLAAGVGAVVVFFAWMTLVS